MIASTQITNTEIFAFVAVLVFRLWVENSKFHGCKIMNRSFSIWMTVPLTTPSYFIFFSGAFE